MMMLVVRRRRRPAEIGRVGQPGQAEWQQDLTEQRGDPEPGPDSAPDAATHRRFASPAGAICAGQVRRYFTSSVAQASPKMARLAQASRLPALAAAINPPTRGVSRVRRVRRC